MLDISNGKADCSFTLTWAVENFNFSTCKDDEEIKSPTFGMDFISNMKWCMMLYPREIKYKNEFIVVELHHEEKIKGARIHMRYEISILNNDDLPVITTGMKDITVSKHGFCATLEVERYRVMVSEKSTLLSLNTLKIRCRLWPAEEIADDVHCTARTQLEVQRVFFKKVVATTKCLQIREEAKIHTGSGSARFSVVLYSTEGLNGEKQLFAEIVPVFVPDKTIFLFKIYILDNEGQVLTSEDNEINFVKETTKVCKIPLREGWKTLNDYFGKSITFCGECFVSQGNVVANVVEETRIGSGFPPIQSQVYTANSIDRRYNFSDFSPLNENGKCEKMENSYGNAREFAADIWSLYEESGLCDLKLKTKTSIFSAHKFILSARSPVFKEMLINNFDGLNILYLTYLDDDTVSQLLTYFYTNLTSLNWDRALKLYRSARKFEMFSLRDRCSHFLQENLDPQNVCEVLKMAHSCNDSFLLHAIYNYVAKHRTKVFQSNGWIDFENTHYKLAIEALRCINLKTLEASYPEDLSGLDRLN